jgi:hypothetical protein
MFYTQVEMKLKALGIRLLNTSQLESGEFDKTLFN